MPAGQNQLTLVNRDNHLINNYNRTVMQGLKCRLIGAFPKHLIVPTAHYSFGTTEMHK